MLIAKLLRMSAGLGGAAVFSVASYQFAFQPDVVTFILAIIFGLTAMLFAAWALS